MWDNWRRGTRFFRSARIAFERERQLWESIEIKDPETTTVHSTEGESSYNIPANEHVEVMQDVELLHTAVIIYSYSIVESEAADRLGFEVSNLGGIEDWGSRLLQKNGREWEDVWGGKKGLVEVSVVRNIVAHGGERIDSRGANRLHSVDCDKWDEGDMIDINFENIRIYRNRLRSLIRVVDAEV